MECALTTAWGGEERRRKSGSLRSGRDGVEVLYGEFGRGEGRTADPSTSLRFGRDDKGEGRASIRVCDVGGKQQVPPEFSVSNPPY
jgi:hypothetical protein